MNYEMIGKAEIISAKNEEGLVNKFTLTVRSNTNEKPSYDAMYDYCKKCLEVSDDNIIVVDSSLKAKYRFSTMVIEYLPKKLAEISKMPDSREKLEAALDYLGMKDDVSFIYRDSEPGYGYKAWNVEFKTASLRGRSTGEVVRFVTHFFHEYLRMVVGVTYEHF